MQLFAHIKRLRELNEYAVKDAKDLSKAIILEEEIAAINNRREKIETTIVTEVTQKVDIFISYSWTDKAIVNRLKQVLEDNGLRCWIDEGKMKGGNQLFAEIEKGITECGIFLGCCSNFYSKSVNCKREINLAGDRNKLIVPILVGANDIWPPIGEMGPLLAGKLYVDMSTDIKFENTKNQLVTALQQAL